METKIEKRHELRDYAMITLGMIIGSIGWCTFLLPHKITIGGLAGLSSVILWGLHIPIPYTYAVVNTILMALALKILGWKFCARTIYAVVVFTCLVSVLQGIIGDTVPFGNQTFLACVVGGVMMGVGMGLALACNASTGGTDVIAAMIHKYHDISLGHIILVCDLLIITSSYLVLFSWEKVIYGYITLFVMSYAVDYVVNGTRSSVQFFVISDKWEEIGQAINTYVDRGCTVIDAHGFYTGRELGMLFVIARRNESRSIFQVIHDIDPKAFVTQSPVTGVFGTGFDHMKGIQRKPMVKTEKEEKA